MISIFTVPSHAELILQGRKTAIVKRTNSKSFLSNELLLVTKKNGIGFALGKIKLEKGKILDTDGFKNFQSDHLISDHEKKSWFPGAKKLYYYKIASFQKYANSQIVQLKPGTQSIQNMYSDELKNYETTNMSKQALADDWKIVTSWFSLDKQGKQIGQSKYMILSTASKIIKEFARRGICVATSKLSKELILESKNFSPGIITDFERHCLQSQGEDKLILFRPFYQKEIFDEVSDIDSLIDKVKEI